MFKRFFSRKSPNVKAESVDDIDSKCLAYRLEMKRQKDVFGLDRKQVDLVGKLEFSRLFNH